MLFAGSDGSLALLGRNLIEMKSLTIKYYKVSHSLISSCWCEQQRFYSGTHIHRFVLNRGGRWGVDVTNAHVRRQVGPLLGGYELHMWSSFPVRLDDWIVWLRVFLSRFTICL